MNERLSRQGATHEEDIIPAGVVAVGCSDLHPISMNRSVERQRSYHENIDH
jgi:hypothetical protein